jgi:D-cysteine desulfhydrase
MMCLSTQFCFFNSFKAAGITTGLALAHGALDETSPPGPTVHAIGVSDTPDYFYDYCAGIVDDMGAALPPGISTESFMRQYMTVHQGKGLGYAASTSEELDFVTDFALETCVVLDPVYSGKALYHFMKHVLEQDPEKFRGKNILFWHTGTSMLSFPA